MAEIFEITRKLPDSALVIGQLVSFFHVPFQTLFIGVQNLYISIIMV